MRLAIKSWVTVSDNPQSAALFGVLDADNPGTLPIPSGDGHWEDVKTVNEVEFKLLEAAKSALSKNGYYLFGPQESASD